MILFNESIKERCYKMTVEQLKCSKCGRLDCWLHFKCEDACFTEDALPVDHLYCTSCYNDLEYDSNEFRDIEVDLEKRKIQLKKQQ